MSTFHTIAAQGISVTLDLRVGHVRDLAIERDGRSFRPLHTAPWVDDEAIAVDQSIVPSLRFLSGDFFCAPFGPSDVEPAPPHGWTANSSWRHVGTRTLGDGVSATYRLDRTVMGAAVEKSLTLRDGHPFLYETHSFIGGSGSLPVANHAMVRFSAGGTLAFSTKRLAETPAEAPESDPRRGRSRLAYPAQSDTLELPTAEGGSADITAYPFAERHEDLVVLTERPGNRLGWAATRQNGSGDTFLSLKNPAEYPITILWFSNGGRDYAPWEGRHVGVLGVEEGRTYMGYGHQASIEANPMSHRGTATALVLDPDGRVEMHNIIGGLPGLSAALKTLDPGDDTLTMSLADGAQLSVPFDSRFLEV